MTETQEFPAFMSRLLDSWARRVGEGDTYDLRELVDWRADVDAAIADAVAIGRDDGAGWSWAEIGDALGISRQAAQQRWSDWASNRTVSQSTSHNG